MLMHLFSKNNNEEVESEGNINIMSCSIFE